MFFHLIIFVSLSLSWAYQIQHSQKVTARQRFQLYYNYLKKDGEKKDVGRLWKNIIFPGIYTDYIDTKEPLKTIKIETKAETKTSQKTRSEIPENGLKALGSYNVADASCAPTYAPLSTLEANSPKLKPITRPINFVAPSPKKQSNGGGVKVIPDIQLYPRPSKPIILFEFESSADCKKVREACSMLDLIVEFRPCPGALEGFSDSQAVLTFGRREVPFMIDNNPSLYRPQLFGTTEIINYLFDTYGPGKSAVPKKLLGGGGGLLSGVFKSQSSSKLKPNARKDNTKMKAITLYGWEDAPYVKQVRKTLNDLGIAHILINCGQGSQNRDKLIKKTGLFQAPYLIDPNTGIEMFESAEIIKYLESTYTA